MDYIFKSMDKETAENIANWKYDEPYSMYSMDGSAEIIIELLNGEYFAVYNNKGCIAGFMCLGKSAQVPGGKKCRAYEAPAIDIGLGMNPKLTGQGLGSNYFNAVLDYVCSLYPQLPVRLTVATFNKRAVRVYEKAGFVKDKLFKNTPCSDLEFVTMYFKAK